MPSAAPAGVEMISLPDGRRVAYAQYGAPLGRPVIAFHGAPACRLMYSLADGPARALGLRIIAPDRPGCGQSPIQPGGWTPSSIAADMRSLADILGLARVGLIGISGGGPYATATAALLGRRVSGLALVSPVGPIADVAATAAIAAAHRWFFLRLPRRMRLLGGGAALAAALFRSSPRLFARVFARLLGGPDAVTLARPAAGDLVLRMTQEALRQGTAGALADLAVYSRPWDFDPSRVTAPTILWQDTTHDIIVPPAAALALAAAIPGCELVRIDGGGHFWVLEHAEDVLRRLSASMDQP